MTTFGVSMGISSREPIARMQDLAARVESFGFDCMWILDCHFTMKDVYAAMILGSLATQRLRFGTGVTTPFNRHPTATATAISAVDEVSNGRAVLGIGAGGNAIYPLGLKPASVAHTKRVVAGLRRILDGEEAQFSDHEPPVRIATGRAAVPVYMAASKPKMLAAAGEVADGVVLMGPSQPDWIREQIVRIDQGARTAGRSRADLFIDLTIGLCVDDDKRRAIDAVKPWAVAQARVFSSLPEIPEWASPHAEELQAALSTYDYSQHLSRHASHKAAISDELAQTIAVAGSASECRSRLQEIAATGVDRVTITLLSGGRENHLKSAGEVVAQLV